MRRIIWIDRKHFPKFLSVTDKFDKTLVSELILKVSVTAQTTDTLSHASYRHQVTAWKWVTNMSDQVRLTFVPPTNQPTSIWQKLWTKYGSLRDIVTFNITIWYSSIIQNNIDKWTFKSMYNYLFHAHLYNLQFVGILCKTDSVLLKIK